MLNKFNEDIWTRYLKAEQDKIRHESLRLLREFVQSLKSIDIDDYRDWVYMISENKCDHGVEFPIRMPLFQDIIFPILYRDFKSGSPRSARFLACFNQLVYQTKEFKENPNELTEIALLQAALLHDPYDEKSGKRLLRSLAWQIDYSLHELPEGLLYGNSTPNADQCDEMIKDLNEFELLISKFDKDREYKNLLTFARKHYNAYREYLSDNKIYGNYENYCDKKGIEY